MKIVEVKWRDAYNSVEWISVKKALELKPPIITSIGYLIYECEDYIVLGMDKAGDGFAGVGVIPSPMMCEVTEITIED